MRIVFCSMCGKFLDKKLDVCPYCNNDLSQEKKLINEDNFQNVNDKNNNKNKKLFIVFISFITVLILVICVFCFKIFFDKDDNENKDSNVSIVNDESSGIPKFIDGTFTDIIVKNEEDAYKALNSLKDKLKFNNVKDEFNVSSVTTSEDVTYYKFDQEYKDIEVYSTNLIISVDKKGKVLGMSGYYIPNINLDINNKKNEEEIKNIVLKDLGENSKIISINKYIYVSNNNDILVFVVTGSSDTKLNEYMVDENTGEILFENDTFDYSNTYSYTGLGMDNKSYTINLEEYFDLLGGAKNRYNFYDMERKISIADYRLMGPVFSTIASAIPGTTPIVVDIVNGKIDMTWENETFIQDAITAMANYEKIYDYYKNVLGRNSFDNKGSKIIINLGVTNSTFSKDDLNNAMWNSLTNQFYIGNYKGKSFSASLDVLAHEFTHGVITYTSKFAGVPKDKNKAFETGALNEGYADILGSLIEGKNWTIAENNTILRDLANPNSYKNAAVKGEKYYYPDSYLNENRTLEQFLKENNLKEVYDNDQGGVHINATVVGHAAYLMYKDGAFKSREEMAKVWYNSLFMLSSYSDFEDCALAVISSAKNLGLSSQSVDKIKNAFIETKMLKEEKKETKRKIQSIKGGISKNIYFIMDGVKYDLNNLYYKDFEDNGWYIDKKSGCNSDTKDSEAILKGTENNKYKRATKVCMYNKKYDDNVMLLMYLFNYNKDDTKIKDGKVLYVSYCGIVSSLKTEIIKEQPNILLPGNLVIGSNSNDVKKVFGKPEVNNNEYFYSYGNSNNKNGKVKIIFSEDIGGISCFEISKDINV